MREKHLVRIHKRNRFATVLFMPLGIALFMVGWALSWIGSWKPKTKAKERS